MVRQLLTVTRLESGALHPRERGRRARAARQAGVGGARAADVAVRRSTTSRAGWLAVADADQLDQVLWALLDNAVKYGERIADRASTSALDRAGERLRLTIADGGPGVAEADRARLFGRFERGGATGAGRGQRPRAVRLARAVPGDGRRPRARADARRARARRSASTSRASRPTRAESTFDQPPVMARMAGAPATQALWCPD